MTKREQLEAKADKNVKKIKALKLENEEIGKQLILLCDDKQWFTEKLELVKVARKKEKMLVGRRHWKEDFKDESTGEIVTIERSEVVSIDGRFDW